MIVLRTPKGWTGPKDVDGHQIEGTFRAHQIPLADAREQSRAPATARGMDAELSAGGAVRRRGPPPSGPGGARAPGHATHGRESARQRRTAAARSASCRTSGLRRRRARARAAATPRRHACWAASCGTSSKLNAEHELPDLRSGRNRFEPPRRGLRSDRPALDGRTSSRRRRARATTAASWRC